MKRIEYDITSLKSYLEQGGSASFYTQGQVDNFNLKVERYNHLVFQYNRELKTYKVMEDSYNSMVAGHNIIVNSFQSGCAGKRYYEDDLILARSTIGN